MIRWLHRWLSSDYLPVLALFAAAAREHRMARPALYVFWGLGGAFVSRCDDLSDLEGEWLEAALESYRGRGIDPPAAYQQRMRRSRSA